MNIRCNLTGVTAVHGQRSSDRMNANSVVNVPLKLLTENDLPWIDAHQPPTPVQTASQQQIQNLEKRRVEEILAFIHDKVIVELETTVRFQAVNRFNGHRF